MPSEVMLTPPNRLLGHWHEIEAGWQAFFDNKETTDNPYPPGIRHDAWRWGYLEAMDYGN